MLLPATSSVLRLSALLLLLLAGSAGARSQELENPILFVGQVPQPADFATIGSTFGNHQGSVGSAPRGGGLFIRYPDGGVRDLTREAGFGMEGFQGAASIAVRDPQVHWSGTKAIFSMVIGGASKRYEYKSYYWQLYEISGYGPGETPTIQKVPNQPESFNNVAPAYGSDGRIVFASDRPRGGERHLYPQLDEYEEAPTVSGLWSLDPADGDLFLLEHSPSGSFTPIVDSFGRVIFTRWDHLQRDQQADADSEENAYGTFNYTSEAADSVPLFGQRDEVFPEPRPGRDDLLEGANVVGHRFNHFFPWMIAQDGSGLETLNHIGRHELHAYFERSMDDDSNLRDFNFNPGAQSNSLTLLNLFQIKEDPASPGLYVGADAPEFGTHSAGQILALDGAPETNPSDMRVRYLTRPESRNPTENVSPTHPGLFRDPLPTSDGHLLASHTGESRVDRNEGQNGTILSRYDFRIKILDKQGDYFEAGSELTNGIARSIDYWTPDSKAQFSGLLWELQPVEVRARPIPPIQATGLEDPEKAVFDSVGLSEARLKAYLKSNDLALIIVRDATTRDDADRQQPFNLFVDGGEAATSTGQGKEYAVRYLQLFQGDQIRGIGMREADDTPRAGRRVLAQHLRDQDWLKNDEEGAPPGSVKLGPDGSIAAFVPARRALSWQLADAEGSSVARERYWLSFQPGEIRTCASCHAVNETDQLGQAPPQNEPEALRYLLSLWKESYAGSNVVAIEAYRIDPDTQETVFAVSGQAFEALSIQISEDLREWIEYDRVAIGEDAAPVEVRIPPFADGRVFCRALRL